MPAAARLRQLRTNLPRLQEFARAMPKKYVMVNIPSAQIEAIENDRVVSRHSGVVGKMDRQTPLLRSAIHELNFNPVWHLPPTVIDKDLIPKGQDMQRRNQDVLAKFGIDAYDASGRKLDSSKINWPAAPPRASRSNSSRARRTRSASSRSTSTTTTPSTCTIRRRRPCSAAISAPLRRAACGCRASSIWPPGCWPTRAGARAVAEMKKTGESQNVALKKPVPLYFVYITAWATEDGIINFRRDLYQKDGVGAVAGAY